LKNKLKPNILFILVDSLRADKFYGQYKSANTPNIDSLIKKGIYFKQTCSSSDYTITGYGSIFTGLYPINAAIAGMNYHKIFSNVPNFLTKLKNYGYHTYCTIDSAFTKLGFSQFFENEDQGYDRKSINLFNGLKERIFDKLESSEVKEPWFYFVHLDDLHIPIRVPEKYQNKKYSERYDLVVSKIDFLIESILKKINLDKTLVVFTSDHGDYILSIDDSKKFSFNSKIKSKFGGLPGSSALKYLIKVKREMERQIRLAKADTPLQKRSIDTRTAKHRYLYDDLVHVPLLYVGYNVPPRGVVSELVRQIDIFPTITELIGLPTNDPIDGRSLVPLFRKEKMVEEPVYLENTIFPTAERSPIPCIGIRNSNYKYFRNLENSEIFLFNVKNDPLEEHNIAEEQKDITNKLETQLLAIREKLNKRFKKPEMSEEETKKVEEELKKLGYI